MLSANMVECNSAECHNVECYYAECHTLRIVYPSDNMVECKFCRVSVSERYLK